MHGVGRREGVQREVGGSVDVEGLDRRVLDVEVHDDRVGERVGVEELGLGFAAVAALAVPPGGTVAVDDVAGGALDLDVGAGE